MPASIDITPADTTESHTMIEHHISTDLSSLSDHHAHAMIDKKSFPNPSSWVDLDTSEKSHNLRDQTSYEIEMTMVEWVSKNTMYEYRMESGIEDSLESSCGRVMDIYGIPISLNMGNHINKKQNKNPFSISEKGQMKYKKSLPMAYSKILEKQKIERT
jgi:hypothetical protein